MKKFIVIAGLGFVAYQLATLGNSDRSAVSSNIGQLVSYGALGVAGLYVIIA